MCLEFKLNCSCFTVYVVLECYCQWQGLRLKFWIVVFEIYVLSMTVIINYLECVYQSGRLEDVMENRNPSQKHSWRHAQTGATTFFPCNRPLASLRLKLRKTRKTSNLSPCHNKWKTQQVKNSVSHLQVNDRTKHEQDMNKTKLNSQWQDMQTWSMTTCTHTHVFSRQLQFCFPVQVHLLLWDKG